MKQQSKFKESEIGKIAEDWDVKKVEDFCEKITSGGTPSRRIPDYWKNGTIPWLKTQELLDNDIYNTGEKITELGFKNSSAKHFPPNTVIMAMYGATVGKLAILKVESTTNQACCAMIPNEKISNHKFLFYALLNFREKLISLACGAAQQNLNQEIIKNFKLPFPQKAEQDKIASILGSLDEKIALNRSMNSTLEAIGQALFKHWFIDFEFPNEEGKPYRSSGGGMVDSELGEVPAGWSVKTVDDVIELAYGKALKDENRQQGNVPVYGSNGQIGWHDEKLADGPGIVVGRKGNPGIVTWSHTAFFPIDTTFYVVPKSTIRSMYYLFFALRLQDLPSLGADSAVPGLNRNMVYMNKMVVPSPKILQIFDKYIREIYNKIQANDEQSRTLAALRDALLSKLMSGEIRVKVSESEAAK